MTLTSLIVLLIVAGLCGAIGRAIAGDGPGGLITAIALGFIGALLGTWMASSFDLPELYRLRVGGESIPIVWSIIGAAVFVAAINLVGRRRRGFARAR